MGLTVGELAYNYIFATELPKAVSFQEFIKIRKGRAEYFYEEYLNGILCANYEKSMHCLEALALIGGVSSDSNKKLFDEKNLAKFRQMFGDARVDTMLHNKMSAGEVQKLLKGRFWVNSKQLEPMCAPSTVEPVTPLAGMTRTEVRRQDGRDICLCMWNNNEMDSVQLKVKTYRHVGERVEYGIEGTQVYESASVEVPTVELAWFRISNSIKKFIAQKEHITSDDEMKALYKKGDLRVYQFQRYMRIIGNTEVGELIVVKSSNTSDGQTVYKVYPNLNFTGLKAKFISIVNMINDLENDVKRAFTRQDSIPVWFIRPSDTFLRQLESDISVAARDSIMQMELAAQRADEYAKQKAAEKEEKRIAREREEYEKKAARAEKKAQNKAELQDKVLSDGVIIDQTELEGGVEALVYKYKSSYYLAVNDENGRIVKFGKVNVKNMTLIE